MRGKAHRSEAAIAELQSRIYWELTGRIDEDVLAVILGAVARWRRTRNGYHLIHVLSECRDRGLVIEGTLATEFSAAARALLDNRSPPPKHARAEIIRDGAMYVMANLRYAGLTVAEAARKAAAWADRKGRPLKASSLQRYYEREGKKLEAQLFPEWDCRPGLKEEMRTVARRMPDAPPQLIGERK